MELITLVDTRDVALQSCEKLHAHEMPRLHRAFSVFLYRDGQMLLQRRSSGKYHSAGLWTNACCSHPRWGEDLNRAVSRRLQQELGWQGEVKELFSFIYCVTFANGLWEYEYDHVFTGICNDTPHPNTDEADAVRWVSFQELRSLLLTNPEQFTAWFLIAAPRVLDYLESL